MSVTFNTGHFGKELSNKLNSFCISLSSEGMYWRTQMRSDTQSYLVVVNETSDNMSERINMVVQRLCSLLRERPIIVTGDLCGFGRYMRAVCIPPEDNGYSAVFLFSGGSLQYDSDFNRVYEFLTSTMIGSTNLFFTSQLSYISHLCGMRSIPYWLEGGCQEALPDWMLMEGSETIKSTDGKYQYVITAANFVLYIDHMLRSTYVEPGTLITQNIPMAEKSTYAKDSVLNKKYDSDFIYWFWKNAPEAAQDVIYGHMLTLTKSAYNRFSKEGSKK